MAARPLSYGDGVSASSSSSTPVGTLLRDWRQRRHFSQLDLAVAAGVSARHLSFVETGRSRPSREMVLHLAEHLDVPLRHRNELLLAAGFAPSYRESSLDEERMQSARAAVDRVLAGHEPYPAVVVDRRWNLLSMNAAVAVLVDGVDPALLAPPANALRVALHPDGMAPRIANFGEWADHLLSRLRRQVVLTGDDELRRLEEELDEYVGSAGGAGAGSRAGSEARPGRGGRDADIEGPGGVAVPLRLRTADRELSFLSTISTFGTAIDITLAELSIEAFFPADEATAAALQRR